MRTRVREHHLSFDPAGEWVVDALEPATEAQLGVYARSVEYGVFMNVRSQGAGDHPLTEPGMLSLLHEQAWGAAPFDAWSETAGDLFIAGGTFETTGMNGEVVLEVFATDGRTVANVAGPGDRTLVAAVTPAVRRLARSLRFD